MMSSTQQTPSSAPAKTLTKNQQKKAVRKSRPRTKQVLFNPFRLAWPTVPRGDATAVLSTLTDCLPQLDIVTNIPQEEYRQLLEAEDRAGITAARLRVKEAAAPLLERRREVLADCTIGFNAASRALGRGELAALLVEAETPALETCFLAPLAAGQQCRAVCLHRLRPTLHARVGISTTVLGLNQAVKEKGHHLNPLYLAVCAAAPCLNPPVALEERTAEDKSEKATAPRKTDDKTDENSAEESEEETSDTESERSGEGSDGEETPQPNRDVSPIPFDQADFISLDGPTKGASRPPVKRSQVQAQLDCLMSIDTVGVPHRRRPILQTAKVMQVTLGDKTKKRKLRKAERKAARAAKKQRTAEKQTSD